MSDNGKRSSLLPAANFVEQATEFKKEFNWKFLLNKLDLFLAKLFFTKKYIQLLFQFKHKVWNENLIL